MLNNGIRAKYIVWDQNPSALEIQYKYPEDTIVSKQRFGSDFFKIVPLEVLLRTKKVISSFTASSLMEEFFNKNKHIDYIMTDHGKILLKVNMFLRGTFNPNRFSKFVAKCEREAEILAEIGGWKRENIILSGHPRWDLLKRKSHENRQILIMFTWRVSFLPQYKNAPAAEFYASKYLNAIQEFFKNLSISIGDGQNAPRIVISIHHALLNLCGINAQELFDGKAKLANPNKLSLEIAESDLIVTDYSSAAFDFIYLDKPAVFYIPDYMDPRLAPYDLADMANVDLMKDRIYNVFYDEKPAIDKIIYYIENDFKLEPENMEKNRALFPLRDQNHRARLLAELEK